MKQFIFIIIATLLLSGCVSKKKFTAMQAEREQALQTIDQLNSKLLECDQQSNSYRLQLSQRTSELDSERAKSGALRDQIDLLKTTNNNLLQRLSDLSVVSKAGAESIQKSLETIDRQTAYVNKLTSNIQSKDSLNLALVMNLKRSLQNINDEDVQIEVKKGVVYISLSDKMLFKSGSAVINPRADEVLGKIAKVVNDHADLDILVEGHTDNVPINTDCVKDNWDLSVKRSTAVVRVLQNKHGVAANRMTAGGRGEYVPKASNESEAGRSLNRRTEIIVLPKLDQFFKLMEAPEGK